MLMQVDQNVRFHLRDELKMPQVDIARNSASGKAAEHLGPFVDYIENTFPLIDERLSVPSGKNETTDGPAVLLLEQGPASKRLFQLVEVCFSAQ
jgi:hypothetical protein